MNISCHACNTRRVNPQKQHKYKTLICTYYLQFFKSINFGGFVLMALFFYGFTQKNKHLLFARSFDLSLRYIDDILSSTILDPVINFTSHLPKNNLYKRRYKRYEVSLTLIDR